MMYNWIGKVFYFPGPGDIVDDVALTLSSSEKRKLKELRIKDIDSIAVRTSPCWILKFKKYSGKSEMSHSDMAALVD